MWSVTVSCVKLTSVCIFAVLRLLRLPCQSRSRPYACKICQSCWLGTMTAKKTMIQSIMDAAWGLVNLVGLFFSTFVPSTREERRVQALERRGARGGRTSSSDGNAGGAGGGLRHRRPNIHSLRQSTQATVPGGGCSGGTCG